MHPSLTSLSSVLSPAPASPAGAVTKADVFSAVLAALIKSGVIYSALAALGTLSAAIPNPVIATAVAGAVSLATTLLRQYAGGPAK